MRAGPRRDILIFDLDGTLVDTMASLADLFCDMLRDRCGVPPTLSRPVYFKLAGQGPGPQFTEVLRRIESPDQALVQALTAEYWRIAETLPVDAFRETLSVLTSLRTEAHTLVVSSGSTTESVTRKTRLTDIDHLLRLALGTDEGMTDMKKGPGHFELVRQSLGLTEEQFRERSAFVGDATYDMQVGRNAGLLTIGRVSGGNGELLAVASADYLISDLTQLRGILDLPSDSPAAERT
jgi:phosphoglycolate phosphatase-like HAD superfamily hydrolase